MHRCRLYGISPVQIPDIDVFAVTVKQALDAGDMACFQLRLKEENDDTIRRATEVLLPIFHVYETAFLINDRPDLAKELGADGCHVGQEDMPYKDARALLGPDAIIGVTCHDSKHLAMEAGEAGADYVAFGAFYPTTTKEPKTKAELPMLTWWQQMMEVPCVAIGGITTDNAEPLIKAGADFIAVSNGIWGHPDGAASAVEAFNALMVQ